MAQATRPLKYSATCRWRGGQLQTASEWPLVSYGGARPPRSPRAREAFSRTCVWTSGAPASLKKKNAYVHRGNGRSKQVHIELIRAAQAACARRLTCERGNFLGRDQRSLSVSHWCTRVSTGCGDLHRKIAPLPAPLSSVSSTYAE